MRQDQRNVTGLKTINSAAPFSGERIIRMCFAQGKFAFGSVLILLVKMRESRPADNA
jgi:hypothetical protein